MNEEHPYAGPTQDPTANYLGSLFGHQVFLGTDFDGNAPTERTLQLARAHLEHLDAASAKLDKVLEIIRSEAALSESSEIGLFAGQVMQKIKELS